MVGSDRGALRGLLPVAFPGPPAAPAVRVSTQRALSPVSLMLPVSGGWNGAAAVVVAGHRDAGRAREYHPVAGEPPSLIAEAAAQFRHPDPVASVGRAGRRVPAEA